MYLALIMLSTFLEKNRSSASLNTRFPLLDYVIYN